MDNHNTPLLYHSNPQNNMWLRPYPLAPFS